MGASCEPARETFQGRCPSSPSLLQESRDLKQPQITVLLTSLPFGRAVLGQLLPGGWGGGGGSTLIMTRSPRSQVGLLSAGSSASGGRWPWILSPWPLPGHWASSQPGSWVRKGSPARGREKKRPGPENWQHVTSAVLSWSDRHRSRAGEGSTDPAAQREECQGTAGLALKDPSYVWM